MKRLFYSVVPFLMMCLICFRMSLAASAAGGEITFLGRSEEFSFSPGSGYTTTDLFDSFKNVMPGDVLEETITVKNKSKQKGEVKLYLQVIPHDSKNPASYSERYEYMDGKDQSGIRGYRDETVASMSQFLSQLTLRVFHGNTLLMENALYNPANASDTVFLGSLERYQTLDLKLELELPAELDNRYANRVGETDWLFTAEILEDPEKPEIPKTGDMILAAVVIMGISGLMFAVILLTGRRRK